MQSRGETESNGQQRDGAARRLDMGRASLISGIIAGVTQAGLFHSYDRALYLSVVNKVGTLYNLHVGSAFSKSALFFFPF